MKLTFDEFKSKVLQKCNPDIVNYFPFHDCSMCGYRCGYVVKGDAVGYDNGCDCTGGSTITSRTWEEFFEALDGQREEYTSPEGKVYHPYQSVLEKFGLSSKEQ